MTQHNDNLQSPGLSESELNAYLPPADYKVMVLLVDDQIMVGEAIRRALMSEYDIGFHYCSSAEEAVQVA